MKRAAFLDRDGVINRDAGYVHRWEDFEFIEGAVDALRRLGSAGYHLVIVTNQSGLARGYFTQEQYDAMTRRMLQALEQEGVVIDAVYHCPHHPQGRIATWAMECDCRKPAPGLLLRASREHGLSLVDSIMIGDKPSDIAAARAAGVGRAFAVRSENDESSLEHSLADASYDSLAHCVDDLLATRREPGSPRDGLQP